MDTGQKKTRIHHPGITPSRSAKLQFGSKKMILPLNQESKLLNYTSQGNSYSWMFRMAQRTEHGGVDQHTQNPKTEWGRTSLKGCLHRTGICRGVNICQVELCKHVKRRPGSSFINLNKRRFMLNSPAPALLVEWALTSKGGTLPLIPQAREISWWTHL